MSILLRVSAKVCFETDVVAQQRAAVREKIIFVLFWERIKEVFYFHLSLGWSGNCHLKMGAIIAKLLVSKQQLQAVKYSWCFTC